MDLVNIFQSKFSIGIGTFVIGILGTWFTNQVFNKRAIFSYNVYHNRVGISTDDAVFGSVRVTLNNEQVPNLYLSTIEIKNESSNDYEDLNIRIYSTDTSLLSEQTQIVETSYNLEWSENFKKDLHIELGQEISQDQRNLYNRQREYKVPSINRGQILKLTFLNSAIVDKDPSLWVDVQKKGVKLVYRQPLKVIHGESHPNSAVAGMVLGCLIAALLIANQVTLWQAVCISMVYGFIAATPGAYFLKSWKKCRLFIAG